MREVLIVANQTAAGAPLLEEVARQMAAGPTRFTLLVPAVDTHPERGTWDEHGSWGEATRRMEEAVEKLRAIGAEVVGRVGGHDAYAAVQDMLAEKRFDTIVVSTLPSGLSRWLGMDLPRRISRLSGVPVVHVAAVPAPAG